MDYTTYRQRLDYALELIEQGKLSSPKDLADKYGCTEKTVRNMLNNLRDEGYQIYYCRKNFKYILREWANGNSFSVSDFTFAFGMAMKESEDIGDNSLTEAYLT